MLTIKQITRDPYNPKNDRIRIWEALSGVEYGANPDLTTGDPEKGVEPNYNAQVSFQLPDGVYCSIDAGVVFVMNDHGKTVSTYRLAGSEWY